MAAVMEADEAMESVPGAAESNCMRIKVAASKAEEDEDEREEAEKEEEESEEQEDASRADDDGAAEE